jgi:cytochrome oxidase Cu insertion factor (SCO1/SenC/PrrC family)
VKSRWFRAGLIAAVLAANPLFAQLGPKDPTSGSATELERIKVGQAAPDFALENVEGQAVNLSDFRGKKAVVLVFYRGYW